jgi:error-prone DNA polymerase
MWSAAQAAAERPDQLPDTQVVVQPPLFGQMTSGDVLIADMWSTGMTTDDHPVGHLRDRLRAKRVLSVGDLATAENGRRIEVGGIVTHRQRPATASGITFLNVEDETGLVNVICSVGVWGRYRRVARESPAVVVRGILERTEDGVVNVVADRIERLPLAVRTRSRDFQ